MENGTPVIPHSAFTGSVPCEIILLMSRWGQTGGGTWKDRKMGHLAAGSCLIPSHPIQSSPILCTGSCLAMLTPALQDSFAVLLLLPVGLRFADKGSPENRKSLGVWPMSTPHTSVSQFPQHWRVHLFFSISLCQHLLFPAKASASFFSPGTPCCCQLPKCHDGGGKKKKKGCLLSVV